MNQSSKHLGMLLGLHCGDSLGATLEFSFARTKDNFLTEIIGGGSFHWKAGAPTDDTELMMCLFRSISFYGDFQAEDVAKNFINWLKSEPLDVGRTTRSSILKLANGISYQKSGETSEDSQGNGSLMRCAPMALLPFYEYLIRTQCAMTHAHTNCTDSDLIFISSLQKAFTTNNKEEIFDWALKDAQKRNLDIFEALKKIPNTSWDNLKTSGYVIDTLCAAYWALLNSTQFKEGVILVVNRGNDADTVGAVTGALLGAFYGGESIPRRWLETIHLKKEIKKLYEVF